MRSTRSLGWLVLAACGCTEATATSCPQSDAAAETDAYVCPANKPVSAGVACSENGLSCDYVDAVCTCQSTGTWECHSPNDRACPACLPRSGSECAKNGLSCMYGACIDRRQVLCANGVWSQRLAACTD